MQSAIVAGAVLPDYELPDQPEAFLQLDREMQVGYGASLQSRPHNVLYLVHSARPPKVTGQ